MFILLGIFVYLTSAVLAAPPSPQRPPAPPIPHQQRTAAGDYSVTHLDIRDAVLSLVRVLQDQMDKLERHEGRERQLGEQLTRSLATLEKRTRGEEKNIENIGTFLGRLEEKVKYIQTTVDKQSDERRVEHEVTGLEFKSLQQILSDRRQDAQSLDRKMDDLTSKVVSLGEANDRISAKFDTLMDLWRTATSANSASDMSENVMAELAEIKEALAKTTELENQLVASKLAGPGHSEWQAEIIESMDSQKRQLALLEEEISKALRILGDLTSSASGLQDVIGSLEVNVTQGLESIGKQVGLVREGQETQDGNSNSSAAVLEEKLAKVEEILRNGQKDLEEKVKGTEGAVEVLQDKMEMGYGALTQELKGLSNVESVLLDTGDSVMETKRRLEYGVQQIMGELNMQLKEHTSSLNSSLQQRFDGLATAVLGNQSRAITNLTSRMEKDITEVWRQIGTLYQEMSRSATILDTIHSQTSKYVNNSLDTMSSMDGKVGQITNRMGEVDDNLNYLLGRMSLVVQEFNMIKSGLGEALVSLKDSFNDLQDIDKVQIPKKDEPDESPPISNAI